MRKTYIVLEHHNPAHEQVLRERIKSLQDTLEALRVENQRLTILYGAEVNYNAALIDLLKLHGIPFKQIFDASYRQSRR